MLLEVAVDHHADDVASRFESIDISFNLITPRRRAGTPLAEMAVDDVMARARGR